MIKFVPEPSKRSKDRLREVQAAQIRWEEQHRFEGWTGSREIRYQIGDRRVVPKKKSRWS